MAEKNEKKYRVFAGLDPATIIALCAFMASLGFIFNLLLAPLKAEQKNLKNGQAFLKTELKNLESKLDLILKDKK